MTSQTPSVLVLGGTNLPTVTSDMVKDLPLQIAHVSEACDVYHKLVNKAEYKIILVRCNTSYSKHHKTKQCFSWKN